MSAKDLHVLFLASEATPFAKTGGLADVVGTLPGVLRKLGVQTSLVLPYYQTIREAGLETRLVLKDLLVPLARETLPCRVLKTRTPDNMSVYLVDYPGFYDRPGLYAYQNQDYGDTLERFCYFCHAALLLTERLALRPQILHCHDWQTGLAPALLKGPYRRLNMTPVFTIHNLGYMGLFPWWRWDMTGLPWSEFFHPDGVEYHGLISLLKAGIVYADAITTVSPTYADEIQRTEYGMGMEGVLGYRRGGLRGILNGADYQVWNPSMDPHLAASYGPDDLKGKRACKEALLREMRLEPGMMDRPVAAIISRLDRQKGFDLLLPIVDELLSMNVGLVVLGSGDSHIQWLLQEAERRHLGKMGTYFGFQEPMAHRIIAGADLFLNPALYEPCGLTQLYALRYGTIPVVRRTGGLEDTVQSLDYQTGTGTGFKFGPYEPWALFGAIREAVAAYYNPPLWRTLQANGMQKDYSWERSARAYLDLYESLPIAKQVSRTA